MVTVVTGDEGNDEVICVRSDKSDNKVFVISRQAKFIETGR